MSERLLCAWLATCTLLPRWLVQDSQSARLPHVILGWRCDYAMPHCLMLTVLKLIVSLEPQCLHNLHSVASPSKLLYFGCLDAQVPVFWETINTRPGTQWPKDPRTRESGTEKPEYRGLCCTASVTVQLYRQCICQCYKPKLKPKPKLVPMSSTSLLCTPKALFIEDNAISLTSGSST